jgi:hypothetical protein
MKETKDECALAAFCKKIKSIGFNGFKLSERKNVGDCTEIIPCIK